MTKEEIDMVIIAFGKCSLALTELLQRDNVELSQLEETFLENHIEVVRLGYTAWKNRHRKSN